MSAYVVEVNEGVVDITRQGSEWWNLYRLRFRNTDRIRDTKSPAVVGGLAEVACDSREDAEWLAAHMVDQGGLPKTAVKVKKATLAPGPNAVLPCGTDSARRRHLAHGRNCAVCGVGDG